jgi:hypothetical protein
MYWKPSDFFLNFSRIMAIEILIKRMILAILILNIYFWLYIASLRKAGRVQGQLY